MYKLTVQLIDLPPLSSINTHQWASLSFLRHHEHSLRHQIHPPLKIVPNKRSVSSCFELLKYYLKSNRMFVRWFQRFTSSVGFRLTDATFPPSSSSSWASHALAALWRKFAAVTWPTERVKVSFNLFRYLFFVFFTLCFNYSADCVIYWWCNLLLTSSHMKNKLQSQKLNKKTRGDKERLLKWLHIYNKSSAYKKKLHVSALWTSSGGRWSDLYEWRTKKEKTAAERQQTVY